MLSSLSFLRSPASSALVNVTKRTKYIHEWFRLMENNKEWAAETIKEDPEYFTKLNKDQVCMRNHSFSLKF